MVSSSWAAPAWLLAEEQCGSKPKTEMVDEVRLVRADNRRGYCDKLLVKGVSSRLQMMRQQTREAADRGIHQAGGMHKSGSSLVNWYGNPMIRHLMMV
jgi:hypothetical protein